VLRKRLLRINCWRVAHQPPNRSGDCDPLSMNAPERVLLISGSLRSRSSNGAVVETLSALDLAGVEATVYAGMSRLPHFNPDDDFEPLPAPVIELRERLRAADAVMLCPPEYAGALPGSFKNLLDWTIGAGSLLDKRVAWINCAQPGRGLNAIDSLRKVLGFAGAHIVEDACLDAPVLPDSVGSDGLIADPAIRTAIGEAVKTLARPRNTEGGHGVSPD
jgi:NAD(P)H-dependent FMN reductase